MEDGRKMGGGTRHVNHESSASVRRATQMERGRWYGKNGSRQRYLDLL